MTMNAGPKTFIASGAIAAKARVKLVSGSTTDPVQVSTAGAGATDLAVGVAEYAVGDGEKVAVTLVNQGGTMEMIAAGVVGRNVAVYGAAAGKISTTVSGGIAAYALEAATADGDIIEVLPVW